MGHWESIFLYSRVYLNVHFWIILLPYCWLRPYYCLQCNKFIFEINAQCSIFNIQFMILKKAQVFKFHHMHSVMSRTELYFHDTFQSSSSLSDEPPWLENREAKLVSSFFLLFASLPCPCSFSSACFAVAWRICAMMFG